MFQLLKVLSFFRPGSFKLSVLYHFAINSSCLILLFAVREEVGAVLQAVRFGVLSGETDIEVGTEVYGMSATTNQLPHAERRTTGG